MTSFDYRLNPLYPIKECSSCGALYTTDYCCSEGSLRDKIICDLNKTPDLSQRPPQNCPKCGNPVDGHYCQGCAYEFIKSSVENLVLIPSEFEGIHDNMCDVPFHDNSTPLEISKDQYEDFSNFNDDSTSIDDDSFSIDNIKYVEASPPDSKLVSSEVMEILIPEVKGIDDDILLTIKDDILREKLLNINLLIAKIKALKDNPTPSSDFMTKLHNDVQNIHEKLAVYIDTPSWDRPTVCYDDDDDEDCTIAITPILSTEEPDNSLSIGDEHLDTILTTELDEFIKSSVENLGCHSALLRKKFKEDLFTYCIENGIHQGLLDASEPSNDNTNVVNALQEPFVIKQDLGKNSSQSPPQINHHCCYECGDSLEDIFCDQCTYELCGKGAHYGCNCLSKVTIIPDPEPFNNQTIDELP
nr:hypothetical protein [Tanacetum cinerariifolium]